MPEPAHRLHRAQRGGRPRRPRAMTGNEASIEIVICMGSSCFSRGNAKNLGVIQDYLKANGLQADVKLVGHLCQSVCKEGPNLVINGQAYHRVDSTALASILEGRFPKG